MATLGISSLKGGVGKTSVTLGLASAALEQGLRTLVVDLDPQADSTLALGALGASERTVADVLVTPTPAVLDAAIAASAWDDDVEVMVGSNDAVNLDGPVPDEALGVLRTLLDAQSGRWDLVIVDCPPSLGGLTRRGLAASDRGLVVTEPGLFAVTAATRALQSIDGLRRSVAPQLQPLGVVVNRVRSRVTEHTFRLEELQQIFGPLVLSPTLPERTALQQAQGAGQPIHSWPGAGARELADSFDVLLQRALRALPSR